MYVYWVPKPAATPTKRGRTTRHKERPSGGSASESGATSTKTLWRWIRPGTTATSSHVQVPENHSSMKSEPEVDTTLDSSAHSPRSLESQFGTLDSANDEMPSVFASEQRTLTVDSDMERGMLPSRLESNDAMSIAPPPLCTEPQTHNDEVNIELEPVPS